MQVEEANEDSVTYNKRLKWKIAHPKRLLGNKPLNLPRDSTTSPAETNKEAYKTQLLLYAEVVVGGLRPKKITLCHFATC